MSTGLQQGQWPGGWGGGGSWPWPPLPGTPVITPTLIAVISPSGPATGGGAVLLFGLGLQGATGVTFGGVPATVVGLDPFGFLIAVIPPPHAAGAVPVVVTTASGASNPLTYTYTGVVNPPPVVTSLAPVTGPAAGGTPFFIFGSNFTGASVTFGGVPATGVIVVPGGLAGITPAGGVGLATVVVTTPNGSTTVTGGYTYV
jgi:hypothetical protein